jgi:simple sugar transport system permease protein
MTTTQILLSILQGALVATTPLVLASMGGLFTEMAGMLNIGLEGLMTAGAFFGVAAASASHNLLVGLACGMAASTLIALVYGIITIKLEANEFVTGLATNLLVAGLVVVLSQQFFGTKSVVSFHLPALPLLFPQSLSRIPIVGALFFGHNLLTYLAWLSAPISWFILRRTALGMRIRATGANPKVVRAAGFSPEFYKLISVGISGLACGLAGADLSLNLSAYVPNIVSGRGWIALVAIYLGRRKPSAIFLACFVFAAADSFSNYAQGFWALPSDFILAIPYIVTLVALIVGSATKRVS